jgi:hypothetical protein
MLSRPQEMRGKSISPRDLLANTLNTRRKSDKPIASPVAQPETASSHLDREGHK